MWRSMRRNKLMWAVAGASALAYWRKATRTRRGRARLNGQMHSIVDFLARTGRAFADGTTRLVRS